MPISAVVSRIARLPRARYRELPGTAHQPCLEDPRQVAGLLLDALAGN